MSSRSGGSCEPCKRKKCKCDRKTPYCSNCLGTGLRCTYAEGNKRGIPTGYLGTLEQRLAETEDALAHTLKVLEAVGIDVALSKGCPDYSSTNPIAGPDTNADKTTRMTEWKKYPLRTSAEVKTWHKFISSERQSIYTEFDRSIQGAAALAGFQAAVDVEHAQILTEMSTTWRRDRIAHAMKTPIENVDHLGASKPSDRIEAFLQSPLRPAQRNRDRVQSTSGTSEQDPNFVELQPRANLSIETSRPDSVGELLDVATKVSASRNLAVTQRNKYY